VWDWWRSACHSFDGDGCPLRREAKRAFEAMMPMQKIDVAKIEAAIKGETVDA
jgi:hypothetical protein